MGGTQPDFALSGGTVGVGNVSLHNVADNFVLVGSERFDLLPTKYDAEWSLAE